MLPIRSTSRQLLVGIAVVAFAGCESTTPTAPARVPTAPSFSAVSDNEQLPFAFNVRGCTERVRVTGTFHVLVLFNVAESGNETDHFHINASGTGSGLTSGATYRFNDPIDLMQQFRDNVRHIESQVEALTLIGQGDVPNMKVRGRFQITVNANGETAVEFDETETICQ
jgi:hypothetical protein